MCDVLAGFCMDSFIYNQVLLSVLDSPGPQHLHDIIICMHTIIIKLIISPCNLKILNVRHQFRNDYKTNINKLNCCFRFNRIISQISHILDVCSVFCIAIGKSIILIFNLFIKMWKIQVFKNALNI